MIVYRVAHATRTAFVPGPGDFPAGPYNGLSYRDKTPTLRRMISAHSGNATHHLGPCWDRFLNGISPNEVCGFDALDSLLDWFERWFLVLNEAGFVVWVYDVPDADVRVGQGGQAVFRADAARLVRTEPLPLTDQQLAFFGPGDIHT